MTLNREQVEHCRAHGRVAPVDVTPAEEAGRLAAELASVLYLGAGKTRRL